MRPEKPPEGWLYKAYDGDVMIDLIFEPASGPVTDEELDARRGDGGAGDADARARAEDVLVTKLLALKEHEVDYDSVLEISRALREQVDWDDVRRAPSSRRTRRRSSRSSRSSAYACEDAA